MPSINMQFFSIPGLLTGYVSFLLLFLNRAEPTKKTATFLLRFNYVAIAISNWLMNTVRYVLTY